MTLNDLDAFTTAYIIAALWTYDEEAPSGEYTESGRIGILFPKIAPQALKQMIDECAEFQSANETKKCSSFRELVKEYGGIVERLEPGTFKESGTNIPTVIVRLCV